MPESRFDVLDLVAEQPRQTLNVAHRHCRSDADRFNPAVDTMQQQIETPRSQSFRRKRLAELDDKLADVAGDGFGRADRLGE